jgi:hypothetical protein
VSASPRPRDAPMMRAGGSGGVVIVVCVWGGERCREVVGLGGMNVVEVDGGGNESDDVIFVISCLWRDMKLHRPRNISKDGCFDEGAR